MSSACGEPSRVAPRRQASPQVQATKCVVSGQSQVAHQVSCNEPRTYASFNEQVYELVSRIPVGFVATYGQVAALAGRPRNARMVGYALHANPRPGIVPCHRVVFRDGSLAPGFAFGGPDRQRELLEDEGVVFIPDTEGHEHAGAAGLVVDLSLCQWQA